jgi:type IV secretory pathway TrbD component
MSVEWPVLTAFVVVVVSLAVLAWIWASIGGVFWVVAVAESTHSWRRGLRLAAGY